MPTLPEYKTIVYATDLGDHTKPAFRSALSLAQKYGAKIIMLHVVEPMSSSIQAVVDTYLTEIDAKKVYKDNLQAVLGNMKQRLKDFCEEELNSHDFKSSHVDEVLVVSGRPSEEIIKKSKEHNADLIVLESLPGVFSAVMFQVQHRGAFHVIRAYQYSSFRINSVFRKRLLQTER